MRQYALFQEIGEYYIYCIQNLSYFEFIGQGFHKAKPDFALTHIFYGGYYFMDSFNETWQLVCDYCKSRITEVAFKTWISRIEPYDIDFNLAQVTLLVPNEFHKETVTRCFIQLLTDSFREIFGQAFQIKLVVPDEIRVEKEQQPIQAESPDDDMALTFSNYIVGSSNKFAHAASQAVAQNPGGSYNPLFIYGNSGLGKTHLLHAIKNEILSNNPDMKIVYVKGDDFTNEIVDSVRKVKTDEFRKKYRQSDVLLVDDVQFIGGKESTQEEFFHTFNALYEARKQIVLTSDRTPKEIKTLEERLRTRFESGLIADIQPPDIETRIAILKNKAEMLDFYIPDEICDYIANKLKTNVRQLEGVVKKIKAKSLLNGEKPSITIAQEVISDVLTNEVPVPVTVERIIEEVARTFGVTADAIRSVKNRQANLSNARHIAIYVVRQVTGLSMTAIGEEFGGRHYSTIVYTIQEVTKKMSKDSKTKEMIEDIIKNIQDM